MCVQWRTASVYIQSSQRRQATSILVPACIPASKIGTEKGLKCNTHDVTKFQLGRGVTCSAQKDLRYLTQVVGKSLSLDGEHVKKNKKIYFQISNFCQQLLFYYFTRVDVKRLTYKIPKAFICPTVPFIINKKNFIKDFYNNKLGVK